MKVLPEAPPANASTARSAAAASAFFISPSKRRGDPRRSRSRRPPAPLGLRLRLLGLGLGCRRGLLVGAAALERLLHRHVEVVAVAGCVGRDLLLDLVGEDELDEVLREALHLVELAVLDRLDDLVRLAVADEVGDARGVDHHLDGCHSAAALLRQEALADDAAQDAGEDLARHLLLGRREELDEAADGLRGVDRVHGREDEVARLGSLEGGLRGFLVAELADEDHVGVLAQDAPESLEIRLGVEPDFALVDDAAPVVVHELDRVLDRDDVLLPAAVDRVDHRREGRRLTRAGRAGHEDEPAVLLGEAAHPVRKAELREARDLLRDEAEGERDRAALAIAVHAEAAQALGEVRRVELARGIEMLTLGGSPLGHEREHGLEVGLGQEAFLHGSQSPVDTGHRRRSDLQVHVAAAELDQTCEKAVQVHGRPAPIGRAQRPL